MREAAETSDEASTSASSRAASSRGGAEGASASSAGGSSARIRGSALLTWGSIATPRCTTSVATHVAAAAPTTPPSRSRQPTTVGAAAMSRGLFAGRGAKSRASVWIPPRESCRTSFEARTPWRSRCESGWSSERSSSWWSGGSDASSSCNLSERYDTARCRSLSSSRARRCSTVPTKPLRDRRPATSWRASSIGEFRMPLPSSSSPSLSVSICCPEV
mmetsp:Transcript_35235/g.83465  ORF Transcript_35235/g.83465 Transcript_35235/m.83465 type:complete len:218 (-) Transcript_35235:151-804(-)